MTALSTAGLPDVGGRVPVPSYDRDAVSVGIVHFGVGGFHRAHQAMYLDALMNAGSALDWGVCGVGVLPGDTAMRDAMAAQDCLFTLVVKHPDGTLEPHVVGSMVEYLFAPDDPAAVVERIASPQVRVVSLTVTEGGYPTHPETGELDERDPGVRADLSPGAVPASFLGLLTEGLARRRERGVGPLTVMSCDNIQGNGEVARKAVIGFARAKDAALGEWVAEHVRFPSSMVDRITPVTSDTDRAVLAERFGIEDRWPVVCEPFTQWVLEDDFAAGRPPVEEVGVQVVDDVHPYELMKLRLLNAGHQSLCYLGYLAGYRYAHDVCADPTFVEFLLGYMEHEGTPSLDPVPGVELDTYRRTLIERFANPEVRDTLARLCAESSDRIPKWLLPVIRHQLATGAEIERSALVVAAWARYAEGTDEQGEPIQVVDRLRDRLMASAARNREDATAFIADREVFGDLVDDERFVAAYTAALRSLHERGAAATVASVATGATVP